MVGSLYDYMNFTLIIGAILLLLGIWRGYKVGLVKGITHLIALIVTMLTLSLIIMLTSSFRAGETRNTIFTIIIMVILGGVYSTIRFFLRSFKMVSKLPILQFANSLMGTVIGVLWVLILYMVLISLGIKGYLGPLSEIITNDIDSNLFLTIFCKYNIFL